MAVVGASKEDPWAGDDVPVGPELGEIVWDGIDDPGAHPGDDAAAERQPPHRRRVAVLAAVASALAVAGIAGIAWPGDDDAAAPTGTSNDAAPTTLDALPPPVTAPSSTGVTSGSVVFEPGGASATDTTSDPKTTGRPAPTSGQIDVPDRLATIADTTILALSNDGRLVELDVPSGVFASTDLGLPTTGRPDLGSEVLVAAPDAAMIATGQGTLVVVTDAGVSTLAPTLFADDPSPPPSQLIPFGWIRDTDGATAFVVIAADNATGLRREFLVRGDGSVSPTGTRRDSSFSTPVFAQGSRFANDAGGAFRLHADGTATRVASGEIIASSADRLVLRECDAQRACRTVLRDHEGAEVDEFALPVTFEPQFLGASLSPDAEALTYASQSFDGDRTLLDVATGNSAVFDGQQLGPFGNSWSSDSTGEFSFGNTAGLTFLDRATGETVTFGDELGTIRALAVRPPNPAT